MYYEDEPVENVDAYVLRLHEEFNRVNDDNTELFKNLLDAFLTNFSGDE